MGHLANAKEEVYFALAERLNQNPVGAPVNQSLMEILHRLYTAAEAELGSKFPLLPMTLDSISGATGMGREKLEKMLEKMSGKGLVVDVTRREETYYMLAPMVVGFFEYTFMRVRDEINMKEMAELFNAYFASPGVRDEIFGAPTKMFKTLVYEKIIPALVETEVLSYERASEIIRQSGGGALTICSCRHKASHLGTVCDAPREVCTSLGDAANWVVRKGLGRPATVDELLRVLDLSEQHGLVHLGDNVVKKPAYICNCCSCCCGVLQTISKGKIMSVNPGNFIPEADAELCEDCGICVQRCPVKAIRINDDLEMPAIDEKLCIGCGVCAAGCPTGALRMARRPVPNPPPENKKEQMLAIAREKGKL